MYAINDWLIYYETTLLVVEEVQNSCFGETIEINKISEMFDYSQSESPCESINCLRDMEI